MRKVLLVALLVGLGNSLFAIEADLIDFNQYTERMNNDSAYKKERANTVGDNLAPVYELTIDDMKLDKWIVSLNSSSRQAGNMQYSMAKEVKTKGVVGGGPRSVLGARIHFPEWANNAYAEIKPPFEFISYTDEGVIASINNGLVNNVEQIYQISVEAYGRNYKHALTIRLKNEAGMTEEYFMGYLYFEGWRKLNWKNPHYLTNADMREIIRLPLNPTRGIPHKKFDSFVVQRHAEELGGDYLFYVANVKVAYDLYMVAEEEDIDDEQYWHIISAITKAKGDRDLQIRSDLLDLRKREAAKMHLKQDGTVNVPGTGAAAPATPATP